MGVPLSDRGKAVIRLPRTLARPQLSIVKDITGLGLSGFVMSITNGSVQIMCNAMLQRWGGDLYVGIMTVINSVREIITMPVNGLTSGAQPVMSFNYGAGEYRRVKAAIRFTSVACIIFSLAAWALLFSSRTFLFICSTVNRNCWKRAFLL